jgi:hypothetical protein
VRQLRNLLSHNTGFETEPDKLHAGSVPVAALFVTRMARAAGGQCGHPR